MKRGLKVQYRNLDILAVRWSCYNRYPDEKGTESLLDLPFKQPHIVTTVTPMKRGLKDCRRGDYQQDRQLQPLPR